MPKKINQGLIKKAKAVVLGVSPDSVDSHRKFVDKHELNFTLLADPKDADGNPKICAKYGVWQEKSMYGRKYMGVVRTTYLIDAKGKLATRSLAVPRRKEDFTDSYIETWLRSVGVDVILPDPPEAEEPMSAYDAEEDGRLAHEHRLAQDMEDDERGETEWDDYNDDPDSLIPD